MNKEEFVKRFVLARIQSGHVTNFDTMAMRELIAQANIAWTAIDWAHPRGGLLIGLRFSSVAGGRPTNSL